MDRCKKCERPRSLCECISADLMGASAFRVAGDWLKRANEEAASPGQSNLVETVSDFRPGWNVIQLGGEPSNFGEDERGARLYAEFLATDRVFECVVPGRFRRSATVQTQV